MPTFGWLRSCEPRQQRGTPPGVAVPLQVSRFDVWNSTVGSTTPHDVGRLERQHSIIDVAGIEGRSVVVILRNVVSRYLVFAGCVWLLLVQAVVAQQAPPAADPAAPAATDPAAPPAAENAVETKADAPAESGGQIRSKIEYALPVISKDEEKALRSKLQVPISRFLKAIAPTNAEKAVGEEFARFQVDRLTMTEYRPDAFIKVIEPARRSAEGPLTTPAAKAILLKAMTDRCVELLAQNPPHHPDVQLNAVILMTSLNAATPANKTPVPYVASYRSIIGLLDNTALPLQCRIMAARGLGRIALDSAVGVPYGDLTSVQRNEITVALAKTLVASDSAGDDEGKQWFRSRVAEALGDCGLAFDVNGSSAPIDALMLIASNPKESLRVRATAMRAATRTAWNAQTNVHLITHETLKLVVEIGNANNAAVAANAAAEAAAKKAIADAKAKDPMSAAAKATVPPPSGLPASLRWANIETYFCFQPMTATQATQKFGLLNQVARPGLIQQAPLVNSAYEVIKPVINHVQDKDKAAKPVAIPNVTLAAVDAWLKANPPANRMVTPVSPQPLP